jgi:hypothetical protein
LSTKSRNTKRISLKAQRTFSSRERRPLVKNYTTRTRKTDVEKAGGSIAEPSVRPKPLPNSTKDPKIAYKTINESM